MLISPNWLPIGLRNAVHGLMDWTTSPESGSLKVGMGDSFLVLLGYVGWALRNETHLQRRIHDAKIRRGLARTALRRVEGYARNAAPVDADRRQSAARAHPV